MNREELNRRFLVLAAFAGLALAPAALTGCEQGDAEDAAHDAADAVEDAADDFSDAAEDAADDAGDALEDMGGS